MFHSPGRSGPAGGGRRSRGVLRNPLSSVAEQLFQCLPGRVLTGIPPIAGDIFPPDEVEILAEVGPVFFLDGVGPLFPALVGHPGIVMNTIEADAQVSPALVAIFDT